MTARIGSQHSAYLRSAAEQPVNWYPWGAEAFAYAKRDDKPILLDIGAVWCHWCHVMDHESYEDPGIAEFLNRDWICIKVDRDERPDVDARYQRAVQALSGQGGWPLTAFLTPEGEVFYGGTYFPPDGRHGRPGFASILTELARLYRSEPDRVREQAAEITKRLVTVRPEVGAGPLDVALLSRAADGAGQRFDFRHGGFGTQPKFPHPATCEFVLARWFDTGEAWLREVVDRTLSSMGAGGIRDHLGGGFHRYSVDARWIVPHFEKMSYDNSELLRVYLHAAASISSSQSPAPGRDENGTPEELALYRDVIEGTVDWVTAVMSDPDGGYYASQDADTRPDDDGDYFTWTPDEARAATSPDEFEALARYYDIEESGEMHHNRQKNVLWIKQPVTHIARALDRPEADVMSLLASGKDKLRAARAARPTPFIDRTIYTAWNAMMASSMLEAGAFLGRDELESHALKTLERFFAEAAPDPTRGVRHALGSNVSGILDDQVQLAAAALDAYEASGDTRWRTRAEHLMDHVWDRYRQEGGALLDTERGKGGEGFLDQPLVPVQDSPTPSPNGVAGIVLSRLGEHTREARWHRRRDELLGALAAGAAELSIHGSTLHRAIDWAVMPPTHIVVVGDRSTSAGSLLRTARRAYRPRKIITWLPTGAPTAGLTEPLRAMLDGTAPRAYVCAGNQCAAPVETSEALAETIAEFGLPA